MFLIYSRVSTLEQADPNGSSLVEQNRKGKAVAQLRGADMFDCATYEDGGVSGTIPLSERPRGAQLMRDANRGDTIIAAKMDRLFRSAIDALSTAQILEVRGVHLILIDIGVEPVTGNGTGKLFFGMLALMAEFERDRILERMQEGRVAKCAKSGFAGGSPPYGFKVEGVGKAARLIPHDDEQKIVADMREIWHTHTPAAACRAINSKGYRDRAGSEFRIGQLNRIMQRIS